MVDDFKFERDHLTDAVRFNKLIQDHFGVDIMEYLKDRPDYSMIYETFGNRAVYFDLILSAVRLFFNPALFQSNNFCR